MILDPEIFQLSDAELRRIYKLVYARAVQPLFLQSFAAALLCAEDEQDFRILRHTAVFFVFKYSLGCYLVEEGPVLERH